MFYFIEYFKAWRVAPWRGLGLALAIMLLPSSMLLSRWALERMTSTKSLTPTLVSVASAMATLSIIVLDDVNDDAIVRQLKGLPGVEDVHPEDPAKLKEKMSALVSSLDVKLPDSVAPTFIHGYRLELDPTNAERTAALIKEYLERMVAKDKVSLSPVKMPASVSAIPTAVSLTPGPSSLSWGIIGGVFLVWLTLLILWRNAFRPRAYLIEQFQRRRWVTFKVMLAGHCMCFVLILPLGLLATESEAWRGGAAMLAMLVLLPLFPTRFQWRS